MNDKKKKVYVETFGCQMNKSDSEHMLGLLDEIGYEPTPEIKGADLMILNTCAIREGAEDKVYSYLGAWRGYKEARPGSLIAVGGCVAQDAGESMRRRAPYVDLVFGTHNLYRLPELVQRAQGGEKVVEIFQELPDDLPETPVVRLNDISAWVSIIYGCDYNCTYCIVPYVRGREKSRSPESIFDEVKSLAQSGYKEVTLLGQNVTAYGHDLNPKIHLGHLLRNLSAPELESIKRLRFVTGHPRDLNVEIIDAVKELPTACEYFHIPIQAGDDRTLRRMARGYNVDFYKRKVDEIRSRIPDAAITTDLIVGFPGETEEEFMNTVRLVEDLAFDVANTAAYSPRQHTPSANWEGQVPEEEKYERLRFLNTVVGEVSHRINKRLLGKEVEILVEGRSSRGMNRLMGRTRTNKTVNFEGPESLIGQLIDVEIVAANPWALRGALRGALKGAHGEHLESYISEDSLSSESCHTESETAVPVAIELSKR
ncbi:MAG: tRNA (N6-isopentenyl adenosine(37)-C2)-methylthiotransferase MiaB [Candidatus Melainabacteria bacterium]|nr:tRNA (N6-isopentenyl adenosine(37)-C2)-methylthiotransferase MiaB [Candidatus Melainabacteria bacterium]